MTDVVGITAVKYKKYQDHSKQEFLTLKEYLQAAEKAIKYFMPLIRPDMLHVVIKDEDAISSVAYAMMIADWKWKPDGGRTRYCYRNDHACYALRSYIGRFAKNYKSKQKSIYDTKTEKSLQDFIPDERQKSPLNILLDKQKEEDIAKLFNDIESTKLSPRESYCIREYYMNDRTYEDIGNSVGVTKEMIRQNILSAKKKIRELI